MLNFSVSRFKQDGSEKSPEEIGDELANLLEEANIDLDSLRVLSVDHDFGNNPNIQRMKLPCAVIKTH